jgi:hypothetical protein
MKQLFAVLLLAAAPALADDASRRAKAESLLDLMNMRQMQDQVIASMTQMALSQLPKDGSETAAKAAAEMTEKLMNLISSRMNWDAMRAEYSRLYAESFTEEELDGIVTFYRSPAGQAMLAKMPVLVGKSMEIGQARMRELKPEIDRITREMMEQAGRK